MESGQDYNPVEDCEETRNRHGPRGKRPGWERPRLNSATRSQGATEIVREARSQGEQWRTCPGSLQRAISPLNSWGYCERMAF